MINEELKKKAETGDPVAMRELAREYHKESKIYGTDGKLDEALFIEALNWMEKSAASGDAEAQHEMADVYRNEEDLEMSFELEKRASEQGFAPAYHNLAVHYQNGYGTTENPEKAFYWYLKSAENGFTESKECVSSCYLQGYGTEKSFEKTVFWLEQAANEGDAKAKRRLGAAYVEGYLKLKADEEKGWALIREAADLGDEQAKELLKEYKK